VPSSSTTYKIFIASPSDCTNERDLVRSYIDEINKDAYFKEKGAFFDVFGWEDVSSAMGRPQGIINEVIKGDADLFVFFFWHRFGSDAGLGLTGTVEEFCEAVRLLNNPHGLCFLVNDANLPKKGLDINQYGKLQDFIESIQKIVLYKTFANDNDFKKEIKLFLETFVQKVHQKACP